MWRSVGAKSGPWRASCLAWGGEPSVVCAAAGVIINFLLTRLRRRRVYAASRAGDSHERKPAPAVLRIQLWPPVHFPYEAVYFNIFITERVLLRHIVTALAIRMLIVGIFVVVVAVPYWNGIGLM
ncbi:MAG: hypothetical protein ACLR0N_16720 [Bilophila wadsworthia]